MRRLYGKLLVGSGDFDFKVFKQCGSYLNRKFWEVNIDWGYGQSYKENAQLADQFLKDDREKLN